MSGMLRWDEKDLERHLSSFGQAHGLRPRPDQGKFTASHAEPEAPKPSKYRAIKTVTSDGVLCDSKAEARRWEELRLLFLGGAIMDLLPHPSFPLVTNGTRTGRFTGDSLYLENGRLVIEDVKSPITAKSTAYRQRLRTFQACYPHIAVREHIS